MKPRSVCEIEMTFFFFFYVNTTLETTLELVFRQESTSAVFVVRCVLGTSLRVYLLNRMSAFTQGSHAERGPA